MFSIRPQLTKSIGILAQFRNFSVSPALSLVGRTSLNPDAAKVKKLKETLKKEKSQLSKLQTKLRAKNQALKEKAKKAKQEAAQKRKEENALKPYRKLTGFNLYIKENCSKENPLPSVGKQWHNMTESEKQVYHDKALEVNEENLKIWTPEPTRPGNAYANFVKENWPSDETFEAATKYVSEEWQQLTTEEKESYAPSKEAVEAYKQAHQRWKEQRLSILK